MIGKFLKNHGDYRTDLSFKELTTIKMGGKIEHFVMPYNVDELIEIYNYAKENNIDYKVLGNGSNLIVGDKPYDGIVISLKHFDDYKIVGNELYVQAGVLATYLAQILAKEGLSGFEFASGIPGTVGGLIYMNAGAYKKETKDIIEEVYVIDDGQKKTIKVSDIDFKYRYSSFQRNNKQIIVGAKLRFEKGDKNAILELMEDRFKRRRKTQPLDKFSAGSCFRNGDDYFVWKLIDEVGLRGYKVNDIEVSPIHSNFIINNGNGSANDFNEMTNLIMTKVKEKYNIDLIEEVEKFNC